MKLFENGVGRPSNEIKQKRRVFVVSAIALCVALVSVLAFALTKVNTNSMKGAANYLVNDVQLKFDITNAWWSGPGSKDKKFNINITKDSKAYSFIAVSCKTLNDCKANDAYERAKKANSGNITNHLSNDRGFGITKGLNKTGKIYYTDYNKLVGTKFYLRVTTYDLKNNWLAVDVYEVNVKDGKRKCNVGYCYPVTKTHKWGKYNTKYVTNSTKRKTSSGTITTAKKYTRAEVDMSSKVNGVWCTPFGKECREKNIGVEVVGKGSAAKYASIVTCTNKSDCVRDDAWEIAGAKNRSARWPVTQIYNTVKLSEASSVIEGRKFYVRVTTYTSNNASNWGSVKVYEVNPTTYTTSGNNKWNVNSKIVYTKYNEKITQTPVKKINLKCPASAKVGQEFVCTVDTSLVNVQIGGANSLAKGYKSSVTNAKTIKIKYTSDLFKNYKSIIKKDSKGKEYIIASVKATKPGFSTATTKVKIYK